MERVRKEQTGPMTDLIWSESTIPVFHSEVLVADVAQTMMALSCLALGCAVMASLVLAVASAARVELSAKCRWGTIGIWGASAAAAVVTAGAISSWGVPIASAASLPSLLVVAAVVRRRLESGAAVTRRVVEPDETPRSTAV